MFSFEYKIPPKVLKLRQFVYNFITSQVRKHLPCSVLSQNQNKVRKSFRIRKISQVPVQGRIRYQSLFLFLTPKHEKWESTRLRIEHDTFHRFQLPPKQPSKSRPLQLKQSKPHVQYQPRLQSIRIGERQWLRRCWWDMKWRLHPMFRRGLVQRPESAIATKAGLWTPAI